MEIWPEHAEDAHEVINAIIEIEAPLREGHIAGIRPICDVDAVLREHRFDRATQQSRIMA